MDAPTWRQRLDRLRERIRPAERDPNLTRIKRRRAIVALIDRRLALLKAALFIAGYAWMVLIPHPRLGRGTYIDENALQPGQVCAHSLAQLKSFTCMLRSIPTGIGETYIKQTATWSSWRFCATTTLRDSSEIVNGFYLRSELTRLR